MARLFVQCFSYVVDCIKHVIGYVLGQCTSLVNRSRPAETEVDIEVSNHTDVFNAAEPKHTPGRPILP